MIYCTCRCHVQVRRLVQKHQILWERIFHGPVLFLHPCHWELKHTPHAWFATALPTGAIEILWYQRLSNCFAIFRRCTSVTEWARSWVPSLSNRSCWTRTVRLSSTHPTLQLQTSQPTHCRKLRTWRTFDLRFLDHVTWLSRFYYITYF